MVTYGASGETLSRTYYEFEQGASSDGAGPGKKAQTEGGLSLANRSGTSIRKNGDGQLESYNTTCRSPDSRFIDPFAAVIFSLYGVDLTGDFSSNRITLSDGSSVLASGPTFLPGSGGAAKGRLGNPFKNATLNQVDEAFQAHVQTGKLQLKYVNPKTGAKAYQNTKSGYSYNLDPGGIYGKKLELPHIDVNYPNPKPLNVAPKKKLPVAGGF